MKWFFTSTAALVGGAALVYSSPDDVSPVHFLRAEEPKPLRREKIAQKEARPGTQNFFSFLARFFCFLNAAKHRRRLPIQIPQSHISIKSRHSSASHQM